MSKVKVRSPAMLKPVTLIRTSQILQRAGPRRSWNPRRRADQNLLWDLSNWIPFFEQKVVFWMSVMTSGSNFDNTNRKAGGGGGLWSRKGRSRLDTIIKDNNSRLEEVNGATLSSALTVQ